jgi:hypothetical protein
MMLVAVLAAAIVASPAPSFSPFPYYRKRKARTAARAPIARRTEWSLFSSSVRHALLRDFLIETRSQTPAFVDARIQTRGGVLVGPTTVDVDFLGCPIVRARVANPSRKLVDVLLRADLHDARGRIVHASAWVEDLGPSAARPVELTYPTSMQPVSVEWSVTQL